MTEWGVPHPFENGAAPVPADYRHHRPAGGVAYWNDWFNALLYINEEELYSLQVLLSKILQNAQFLATNVSFGGNLAGSSRNIPSTTVRMAIAVVGTLPVLIIYPFSRNTLKRPSYRRGQRIRPCASLPPANEARRVHDEKKGMKYINQKRQLTYLMAAVSIVQFFYSLPNTTIPLFVLEMGGGEAEVGLIGGIISVGALLFRGIIGYITDVKGRRIVYLAGVIIYAATTFGYAVSPNIAFLMVFKAVSGVGLCAVTSGACAIIADLSGENATRGLTALMTVQMVAGLFAPTLGMALGEIIGYRLLYTFSAIGFLPAILLVMPIRYENTCLREPAQKPEKRSSG